MKTAHSDDHLKNFLMISAAYLGINDRYAKNDTSRGLELKISQALNDRDLSARLQTISASQRQ